MLTGWPPWHCCNCRGDYGSEHVASHWPIGCLLTHRLFMRWEKMHFGLVLFSRGILSEEWLGVWFWNLKFGISLSSSLGRGGVHSTGLLVKRSSDRSCTIGTIHNNDYIQVVPSPVKPYSAKLWPKTPLVSSGMIPELSYLSALQLSHTFHFLPRIHHV